MLCAIRILPSLTLALLVATGLSSSCRTESPPPVRAAGSPSEASTTALEAGAAALQQLAPIRGISFYLDGFHAMKDAPQMQMEAHHYCNQVNEELAQCVIFDGNTKDANMIGIEYIISQRLFDDLPADEQASWHPHNYEILSGQLIAPGLPDATELALLKKKMNSYGKTWHIWDTGHGVHDTVGNELPVGSPKLAWSFNADGEIHRSLIQQRDARFRMDTQAKRAQRQELVQYADPQRGVDDLASAFPERRGIDGVKEERAMGR